MIGTHESTHAGVSRLGLASIRIAFLLIDDVLCLRIYQLFEYAMVLTDLLAIS